MKKYDQIDKKLLEVVRREILYLNECLMTEAPLNESIGLYNGLSGLCLYLYQNYKLTHDVASLNQLHRYLDKLFENIEIKGFINGSFSSGMAGCSWMIKFLSNNEIVEDIATDLMDEIDLVLLQTMKDELNNGNIDQLNGAIGIARYFLKAGKYKFVEMVILHLQSISVEGDGEIKWVSENWHNKASYYNFSLAHGASGILQFLHQCYFKGVMKDECKNLIEGGVNFLLNNLQDYSIGESYFPNSIKVSAYRKGDNEFQASRMSWCYGDLGIFHTLFKLAPIVTSIDLRKIAVEGFLKMTNRKRPESTMLVDPGFCHGTAGVSYLFLKMWLATDEVKFRETAEYWLWETLKYKKNNEYIFLTGNFENRSIKSSKAFLDGASGVAMVYSTF